MTRKIVLQMKNSSKRMVGDAKSVKNLSIQKKFMNITCESMMEISNVQSAKKNFEINRAWIFISSFVEKAMTKLISKSTNVTNVGKSLVRNRNSNSTWVSCLNLSCHHCYFVTVMLTLIFGYIDNDERCHQQFCSPNFEYVKPITKLIQNQ